MAILKVSRLGHPVLRAETGPVPTDFLASREGQRLVDDMVETMHEYAGVGLAANQVHVGMRLAVLECRSNARYPDRPDFPLTVVVNPRFSFLSEEKADEFEGCLSIPDLRGVVPRSTTVKVESLDRNGNPQNFEASGFMAVVLQHEVDHLDGCVFLDRMRGLRTLAFQRELARFGPIG